MRTTMTRPNTLSSIDEDDDDEEVVICWDDFVWQSGRGGKNDGVWRHRLVWGGKKSAIGSTPNPKTIECAKKVKCGKQTLEISSQS